MDGCGRSLVVRGLEKGVQRVHTYHRRPASSNDFDGGQKKKVHHSIAHSVPDPACCPRHNGYWFTRTLFRSRTHGLWIKIFEMTSHEEKSMV